MAIDPKEFERLVSENSKVIAAAVRRVCRQRYASLVPDVTQEVHVKLWKILESGKEIENLPSYIYRVALTTGLSMVEQAQKQWTIARNLEQEPSVEIGQDSQLTERGRLIEELLAQLQADQANALRAYLAGYNHTEIARLFNWSESVARHKVYRSIDKLKRFMAEQDQTHREVANGRF